MTAAVKSFFASLLTAMLLAVGITSIPASAANPKPTELSPARLNEAKTRYIDTMILGFKVGWKLSGREEPSAEQFAAIRKVCEKWLDDELIPFLRKKGHLEQWAAMQFDEDIREINRQALRAETKEEFQAIVQKSTDLCQKKFPDFCSDTGAKELNTLMMNVRYRVFQLLMK